MFHILFIVFYSLQKTSKYFFELIHKQNDQGTDHVEVAVSVFTEGVAVIVLHCYDTACIYLQWQLKQAGHGFSIIDSKFISLYIGECVCVILGRGCRNVRVVLGCLE